MAEHHEFGRTQIQPDVSGVGRMIDASEDDHPGLGDCFDEHVNRVAGRAPADDSD
jgi:hypothetical protein